MPKGRLTKEMVSPRDSKTRSIDGTSRKIVGESCTFFLLRARCCYNNGGASELPVAALHPPPPPGLLGATARKSDVYVRRREKQPC